MKSGIGLGLTLGYSDAVFSSPNALKLATRLRLYDDEQGRESKIFVPGNLSDTAPIPHSKNLCLSSCFQDSILALVPSGAVLLDRRVVVQYPYGPHEESEREHQERLALAPANATMSENNRRKQDLFSSCFPCHPTLSRRPQGSTASSSRTSLRLEMNH